MNKKVTLKIEGMTCGHCANSVTNALNKLEGASEIEVNPQSGEAKLLIDAAVADSDLAKAVDDAGYKLVSVNG